MEDEGAVIHSFVEITQGSSHGLHLLAVIRHGASTLSEVSELSIEKVGVVSHFPKKWRWMTSQAEWVVVPPRCWANSMRSREIVLNSQD